MTSKKKQLPEHPFDALTMRDVFAAIALTKFDCRGMESAAVALRCYDIADAMIAERDREQREAEEREAAAEAHRIAVAKAEHERERQETAKEN